MKRKKDFEHLFHWRRLTKEIYQVQETFLEQLWYVIWREWAWVFKRQLACTYPGLKSKFFIHSNLKGAAVRRKICYLILILFRSSSHMRKNSVLTKSISHHVPEIFRPIFYTSSFRSSIHKIFKISFEISAHITKLLYIYFLHSYKIKDALLYRLILQNYYIYIFSS